jgi:hypothetical protein
MDFLNLPQNQQWRMIEAINRARSDNSTPGSYAQQVWDHNAKMNGYWSGMDSGNTPKVRQYGGSMRHMRDISGPTARDWMDTLGGYEMNDYLDSFSPITNYSTSMGGSGVSNGGAGSGAGYSSGREDRFLESLLAKHGLIPNNGDVARFADDSRPSAFSRKFNGGIDMGRQNQAPSRSVEAPSGWVNADGYNGFRGQPRTAYRPYVEGAGSPYAGDWTEDGDEAPAPLPQRQPTSFLERWTQGGGMYRQVPSYDFSAEQAAPRRMGAPDDAYYRNWLSQDEIGEQRRSYAKQHPKTHAPDGNPWLVTPSRNTMGSNFNNRNRFAQEARAGGYDSDIW